MSASYPTSVKTFAVRSDGQTIAAAHVGDLQDEVHAVEDGLKNGLAHALKPTSAGGQDLGTTTLPWANGYFTGLPMDIGLCEGRLTLTSGTPVTTADVTAATSIYFAPYKGNRIALYDGTNWALYTFTELTLALGTLTSALTYDVFVYNNAGTLTLEALAWSTATARATALTTQNGVLVKTGATTRRYLGTFYTTSTTTTENSAAKRLLWNYYNRVDLALLLQEVTASWTYATSTIRQARATASNQVEIVVGVAEVNVRAQVAAMASASTRQVASVGIGFDSTTAYHASNIGGGTSITGADQMLLWAAVQFSPTVGRHTVTWLEWSQTAGTTTFYGTNFTNFPSGTFSGLSGSMQG
jgi:hypothetical protein